MKLVQQIDPKTRPIPLGYNVSRAGRIRRRFVEYVRVGAYLSVVGFVTSLWLLRAADAHLAESVRQFGDDLVQQLDLGVLSSPQPIVVNGQTMYLSSLEVEQPVAATLGHLRDRCKKWVSPALSGVGQLPATLAGRELAPELRNPVDWAVDRQDAPDGTTGQVACIAPPQEDAELVEVLGRIARFAETGDLAEVGNARYFLARRVTESRTHVLAIWTEGSFDLLGMFPGEGDAPGTDSALVPRPPAARRVFSAVVPSRPYAARVYASRASRQEVLEHYDATLSAKGWQEQPMAEGDELRVLTRAFSRDGKLVFVILDGTDDEETPVTLVEMSGEGFAASRVVPSQGSSK
jgi:hypothetical protein